MTTTRIIQRELVVQPSDDTLPAVTLDYAWSSFMNTYAVWPARAGDSVTIRRTIVLQAGNYYVTGTVDNYGSVNINGQYNINLYNYDANISRTSIGNSTLVNHPGGPMTVTISATNTGGPRGVAVTISNAIKQYISTNEFITTVGDLVWSTRTPGTVTIGRYQVTMPFRAKITAYAWGAGGGGGGDDTGSPWGGTGAPGLYNTTIFTVNRDDILEVFVGKGGLGGGSINGSSPGGTGGFSRINVNGNNALSFNGGTGGTSGSVGSGGGGGGGGGASGIIVNNVPVLVAGGGGGGGGAGDGGSAQGQITIASISNNATGQSSSDYRGENGQSKGNTNGGAGGAGGGGYPGGQGGATVSGDQSAVAGQCGGNFPLFGATTGTNTPYYKAGFSAGGARPGGNGQNGRVVLLIEPLGLASVKVINEWEQIQQAFVKVDDSWRDIDKIYIKIQDKWREISGSGQGDIELIGNTQNYGISTRSYS